MRDSRFFNKQTFSAISSIFSLSFVFPIEFPEQCLAKFNDSIWCLPASNPSSNPRRLRLEAVFVMFSQLYFRLIRVTATLFFVCVCLCVCCVFACDFAVS